MILNQSSNWRNPYNNSPIFHLEQINLTLIGVYPFHSRLRCLSVRRSIPINLFRACGQLIP